MVSCQALSWCHLGTTYSLFLCSFLTLYSEKGATKRLRTNLYRSFRNPPRYGVLDKTYYVYSFAFLITRISAVALYAANINSESKKPRYYLNTLPHYVYNVEVSDILLHFSLLFVMFFQIERLLYQTKFNTAALTGHKVFRVTRSLILRVRFFQRNI
jgi:hypothetical protein